MIRAIICLRFSGLLYYLYLRPNTGYQGRSVRPTCNGRRSQKVGNMTALQSQTQTRERRKTTTNHPAQVFKLFEVYSRPPILWLGALQLYHENCGSAAGRHPDCRGDITAAHVACWATARPRRLRTNMVLGVLLLQCSASLGVSKTT